MAFRAMRRKTKEISREAVTALLRQERRGVLAVNGEQGYPYAVPINYWYDEEQEKIYFHGASQGYKAEMLKACDKICFTVYGNERRRENEWAPYMQSAVVFGRCHAVESRDAILELVRKFARKYYPSEELIDQEVAAFGHEVQMFAITIEHMTGKEIQER